MDHLEFMKKILLWEIIDQYNLIDIEDKGWFHIKSLKRMYKLQQARELTNTLLKIRLIEAHD